MGLFGPFLVSDAADNMLEEREIWKMTGRGKRPSRVVWGEGLRRHWRWKAGYSGAERGGIGEEDES